MDLPLTLALAVALVLALVAGVLVAALAWCGIRLFAQTRLLFDQERRLKRVEKKAERLDRVLASFLDTVGVQADQNGQVHRKGAT